ncbi:hypothetical protein FRB90_012475 [Tulasnella sp. 427]|nr:hypothetical protein FRB90_012475 [Tulasnella sp. 427]
MPGSGSHHDPIFIVEDADSEADIIIPDSEVERTREDATEISEAVCQKRLMARLAKRYQEPVNINPSQLHGHRCSQRPLAKASQNDYAEIGLGSTARHSAQCLSSYFRARKGSLACFVCREDLGNIRGVNDLLHGSWLRPGPREINYRLSLDKLKKQRSFAKLAVKKKERSRSGAGQPSPD